MCVVWKLLPSQRSCSFLMSPLYIDSGYIQQARHQFSTDVESFEIRLTCLPFPKRSAPRPRCRGDGLFRESVHASSQVGSASAGPGRVCLQEGYAFDWIFL